MPHQSLSNGIILRGADGAVQMEGTEGRGPSGQRAVEGPAEERGLVGSDRGDELSPESQMGGACMVPLI